jgi:hypothetical protein
MTDTWVLRVTKRKGEKVVPVDVRKTDGSMPGGETFWKTKILAEGAIRLRNRPPSQWDKYLIPRFTTEPVGIRLTGESRRDLVIRDRIDAAAARNSSANVWESRNGSCMDLGTHW